jgi:hypothetical protein
MFSNVTLFNILKDVQLTIEPLNPDIGVDGVVVVQRGRVRVGGQTGYVRVGSLGEDENHRNIDNFF